MLTVVLKATRGDPQVKVPAPGLETGSHPKKQSASRAARADPPSRARNAPPDQPHSEHGGKPRHRAAATRARQQPAAPRRILRAARPPRRSGLEGRFTVGGQLLHSWLRPVRSSSGCLSMSVVPASFWHTTGTAYSPPPGPVRSPPPGPAPSAVHPHEDHDEQDEDRQGHPIVGCRAEAHRTDGN